MRLDQINDGLRDILKTIIVENECGGDSSLAYEFSDPDGIRTGKSGYSFGIVQYDINNNGNALIALREMGFTTDEVYHLRSQDIDISSMNRKLYQNKKTVDEWDLRQINECLDWSLLLCNEISVEFSKYETFLNICDYHNQFSFSRGGKMYSFLKSIDGLATPEMILDFKLSLPWGQNRPDDVKRRYRNIVKAVTTF